MEKQELFQEVQRYNQWWLWTLLIAIGILLLLAGPNLGALILIGVGIFLLSIKLTTRIDSLEVNIHLFPLVKKRISWEDVKEAKLVDYGFAGGWGIRYFSAYGTVYNIRGSKGLAMELKDGKKLCIGTQKDEEMKKFLKNLKVEATQSKG